MYKIVIKNTVTHQKYTYDNVEDKNNGKKLFYNFSVDTSNLDDGEYTLSLYDGNNLINTELLKIGNFNNKSIQYSKGNNIYIDAKPAKIDVAATGLKFGYTTLTEIPDILDFSNATDMSYMFANWENITTISPIDTSNATNMTYMFYDCSKLQSIPLLNTSNVTDMSYMFTNCENLTTIPLLDCGNVTNMSYMFFHCRSLQSIPLLNTSNVTNMSYMFNDCDSLTTIPLLNTSNVTNMTYMFYDCSKLQSIPLLDCGKVTKMSLPFSYSNIDTLADLGGFKDLKISITSGFLDVLPNLTVESLMNVINNVYDLTANGLSGKKLKFGQTNLDKLTPEQIAVATAKGWTLIA